MVGNDFVLTKNNYEVTGKKGGFRYQPNWDYSEIVEKNYDVYEEKKPSKNTGPRKLTKEQAALKEYNKKMKDAAKDAQVKRACYFSDNLNIFSPFLDEETVKDLKMSTTGAKKKVLPPFEEVMAQPEFLKGTLRDYQMQGLNFLAKMHHHGVPCILGDEMGLGKTYQTISLLCYLKETLNLHGPSLIVCPLSVLSSWQDEFEKWAPHLDVRRLHSSSEEGRADQVR